MDVCDGRSALPALPASSKGSHEKLHLTFLQHSPRACPGLLRGHREAPATSKVETSSLLSADELQVQISGRPHSRGAAGAPKGISREQSCSDNSSFKPKQRLLQSKSPPEQSVPGAILSHPPWAEGDAGHSTPGGGENTDWRNKTTFTQQLLPLCLSSPPGKGIQKTA